MRSMFQALYFKRPPLGNSVSRISQLANGIAITLSSYVGIPVSRYLGISISQYLHEFEHLEDVLSSFQARTLDLGIAISL